MEEKLAQQHIIKIKLESEKISLEDELDKIKLLLEYSEQKYKTEQQVQYENRIIMICVFVALLVITIFCGLFCKIFCFDSKNYNLKLREDSESNQPCLN